ncbi:MAG: signal peptidase I [Planctomycetaceae bacterium]|nr:signal peptidase I [Planctomycetaceae bacterium]
MASDPNKDLHSVRDTVESIWVAIILAFVLRAFMVEAFVIPTGSMAPRLMGEHWDLRCPSCGLEYAFGYNEYSYGGPPRRGQEYTPMNAACPSCRREYTHRDLVNNGDRVLVLKYVYPFRSPQPFDVVVFHNPQSNEDNYIKRLIGLPGETIELVHGDVFVNTKPRNDPEFASGWQIRRKPPRAQEAMWQVLFDNDYRPDPQWIKDAPQCPRWVVAGASAAEARRWNAGPEGRIDSRTFSFAGGAEQAVSLSTTRGHFKPIYGYNPQSQGDAYDLYGDADVNGDLRLSTVLMSGGGHSQVSLTIMGISQEFRAVVDTGGSVELFRRPRGADSWGQPWQRATIEPIGKGKGCEISLAHADYTVTVSVAGRAVINQPYEASYHRLMERLAQVQKVSADAQTLFPTPQVSIAGSGEAFELLHVRVDRDVYYISRSFELEDLAEMANNPVLMQYALSEPIRRQIEAFPAPSGRGYLGWGVTGRPITLNKNPDNPDLDSFFVLGDNSPASLDGRAWVKAAPTLKLWKDPQNPNVGGRTPLYQLGTVPRYNMIGKAIYVYWPAGFRPPGAPSLPILPNVGKMRLIY